jgi:AcrR family transcriptional regulator
MARWSKEKRAQVREVIYEAARAAFEEEGFEGASMRAIASRAGVGVGTLFNYAPDKLALLHAVLRDDLDDALARCVEGMPAPARGLAPLLTHIAGVFFSFYAERPALSRALLERSLFARGEAGDAFRAQAEAVGAEVVARVERMKALGLLAEGADARAITLAFFSHYYFALISGFTGEGFDAAGMTARVELLAHQLTRGVGAGETIKESSHGQST